MKSQGTKESRNRGVKWLARILESSNPGILLLLLAAAAGASPDTVEVRCVTTYDGPESREDRCTGMLVAPDGSVYLAGYSFGTKTDFDFAVLKVDTTGRIVWTSRFGSPLGCEDRPWCLARDSAGDIVAVGGSIADMAKMWDFRIVKYRPNGDTAWARLLDFPSHAEDKIAAAGILPDNSIIVTGTSRNRPAAGRNLSNDPLPSIPSPLKGVEPLARTVLIGTLSPPGTRQTATRSGPAGMTARRTRTTTGPRSRWTGTATATSRARPVRRREQTPCY